MAGEIGRLNVESNPVSGRLPGYTPQHKESDGSFIDTGVDNPLPSKLYAQDENGNLVQVKTTANGEVLTQLTGRNVELASASAVTVTAGSQAVVIPKTSTKDVEKVYASSRCSANVSFVMDLKIYILGNVHVADHSDGTLDIHQNAITDIPGSDAEIRIKNDDTSDRTFDVALGGIR